MEYNFRYIEKYWQQYWKKNKIFQTKNISKKPKFYILDMFPYPSGSGLHVGHLLGYIASDILARYKRLQGYNVLHPMGFDSFGLPTEQYSIKTGNHPKKTTKINIKRYKKQLNNIGFSFDWDREIRTSDPKYYRWTQYIFVQLFNHWYDQNTDSAKPIKKLIKIFEKNGNLSIKTNHKKFSSKEWKDFSLTTKENILQMYRLAFYSESIVNWCPELGTVLANDEISNGKSKRCGNTVYKKKMIQWNLRITAYAERLLKGLEYLDWPTSIKEAQINWIGKSYGVNIIFKIINHNYTIQIFTTRPDTIFGVSFIVLSINHTIVNNITTIEQYEKIQEYINESTNIANIDNISGEFTGAYALHPFTETKIPIYISNYILDVYGTGAVMAVPAHDKRDHKLAKKFGLNILEVIKSKNNINVQNQAYEAKEGVCINSYFLNGLNVKAAIEIITKKIEEKGIGFSMINYHLRDAVFSRQRYWGEPIPIYFQEGIPKTIDKLPLVLPNIDYYLPLKNGKSPLNRAKIWAWDEIKQKVVSNDLIDQKHVFPIETDTMPSWAGSSWYFIRYMDPLNIKNIVNPENESYWKNVDLYIGGSEHTTGHLIYARFFHKFLKDIGIVKTEEPFKKLINQGLILGYSAYILRDIKNNILISYDLVKKKHLPYIQYIPIDINLLKTNNELDVKKLREWHPEFFKANLYMKNRLFLCKRKMEKMSKSKFNIINPDIICNKYGADTLRLYEMFLGPLRYSKPWDIQGITGVHNFLKKFWMLFYNKGTFYVDDKKSPSTEELKILHKTIKKIIENMQYLSFNTSVSTFMISVNNLIKLKCNKRVILEPLVILLSPFAPHITEELWCQLGYKYSVSFAKLPKFCSEYLSEKNITYPIMFNGKLKFKMDFEINVTTDNIKNIILNDKKIINFLNGKKIKNFIIIPNKIINIVI